MPRNTLRRVPEGLADLRGPLAHGVGLRERLEADVVDGDRERRRADRAVVGQVDEVAMGLVADALPDEPDEVGRAARQLEADQVGTQQALEDLAAPRQLLEQLGRREGDVQVEADPEVGTELAQHLRHELELVVVHPDGRVLGGPRGGPLGEPLVDAHVGVPPLAVELRLGDQVVVERPEGGVAEALVELARSPPPRGRSGSSVIPSCSKGSSLGLGAAGPADPDAAVGAHDRLDRGHQTAGGAPPAGAAVGIGDPVHRQSVRHDDEVGCAGRGHAPTLAPRRGTDLTRWCGLLPRRPRSRRRSGDVSRP